MQFDKLEETQIALKGKVMQVTKKQKLWILIVTVVLVAVIVITVPCAVLLQPILTVEDTMLEPTDPNAFVATGNTDAYGNVIENLQEAVNGKEYWLASEQQYKAEISADASNVVMDNGIIRRVFHLPVKGDSYFYTSEFKNTYIEKDLINSIMPECVLGLYDKAYDDIYLPKTDLSSTDSDRELIRYAPDDAFVGGKNCGNTFHLTSYEIFETCEARFTYRPDAVWSDPAAGEYPSKGKRVEFVFRAVAGEGCDAEFAQKYADLEIRLVYEIYDNVPVIKKCVQFYNEGEKTVTIGRLLLEVLETSDAGDDLLEIETSYVCGDDTTVSFNSSLPCECAKDPDDSASFYYQKYVHSCYDLGPAYQLDKNDTFETFDTYEYVYSTYWFEQQSKERLAIYRILFPWIMDNPLTFHSTQKLTRQVIDHVAEAGFEMVIQSFGVQDNTEFMMTRDHAVLDEWKSLVAYAHSKGVGIGIYQWQYKLDQYKTAASYGKNDMGQWGTWCIASTAFEDYYRDFIHFLEYTGVDCVEIDGPYPNCACNNGEEHQDTSHSSHSLHNGYFDSKVKQWENGVRTLTAKLRELGVYVKTPAWYYMSGSNKCGIGYEEIAWSQPRKEQMIYGRQILHNGSYVRTAAMSWTFMPLDVYHGGGLAASYSPYVFNQFDYDWGMGQNLGNGLTSDIRGKNLYDSSTLKTIQKWTSFFKQHRSVVNADIVHIKQASVKSERNRSEASGIDAIFHTNARLKEEKGLLWVYNQTKERRICTLTVPLFYTGLTDFNFPTPPVFGSTGKGVKVYGEYPPNYSWLPTGMPEYRLPQVTDRISGRVSVTDEKGNTVVYSIDSNGNVTLHFTMEPMTYTHFLFKAAN